MRLTSNVNLGLVLGIATASVILALGGCTATISTSSGAMSADPAVASGAELSDFSESERERILAVQDIVSEAARTHELEPSLINAVIWVESRFDPRAKSPAGARGLMQLMPATAAYLAKRMGENNARAYDPEFNVNAGALYLAQMLEKFGDERLAVAAYHAGPGNVKRWLEAKQDFPDYSEAYVAKVMDARARFVGVEQHGRKSTSHSEGKAGTSSARDEEELEVPDVDSLPDAADIHGVPRVIYERPQARQEPQPKPQPAAQPKPQAPKPQPVPQAEPDYRPVDNYEPVFVPRPELDLQPDAPPPGWETKSETEPAPKPEPKPKPKTEDAPEPPEEQSKTGLGVLPDL